MIFQFKKPPKFKGKHSFNIVLLCVLGILGIMAFAFILIVFYNKESVNILNAF